MTTQPPTDAARVLLPCPFCGGEARRYTASTAPDFENRQVQCARCGASAFDLKWNTRQQPEAGREGLPDVAPGHWDTPAGRDMALATLDDPRMAAERARMSDLALANEVFMSPGIGNLTRAKERIRWLSAQLVVAQAATRLAVPTVVGREEVARVIVECGIGSAYVADDPESAAKEDALEAADRILSLLSHAGAGGVEGSEDTRADAYAAEYVMSTEGNDYVPTEWERELIVDALHGFLADRPASPAAVVGGDA